MTKQSRNKSYLGKLLILLVVAVAIAGFYTSDIITASSTKTWINETPIVNEIKTIVNQLSTETDQAVKEAQEKVQKEKVQLLSEIADLQAEQEKKVERLEELESLGFTPESN